jgi:hypothetical protein
MFSVLFTISAITASFFLAGLKKHITRLKECAAHVASMIGLVVAIIATFSILSLRAEKKAQVQNQEMKEATNSRTRSCRQYSIDLRPVNVITTQGSATEGRHCRSGIWEVMDLGGHV